MTDDGTKKVSNFLAIPDYRFFTCGIIRIYYYIYYLQL